jgi:uncharacterized membrane protein required for colicin V production
VILTPSNTLILGFVVGVFAVIGWRRGVSRELFTVIVIVFAMLFAHYIAPDLRAPINKLFKLVGFVFSGGIASDDLSGSWAKFRSAPDLVPQNKAALLSVAAFMLLVAFAYAVGQMRRAGADGLMTKVLGLLTGAVNGFLIVWYLFPIVFTGPETTIKLSSQALKKELVQPATIARMAFFFLLVLIAWGLYTASSARRKD